MASYALKEKVMILKIGRTKVKLYFNHQIFETLEKLLQTFRSQLALLKNEITRLKIFQPSSNSKFPSLIIF
jgi:hypothetical protein